MHPHPRFENSLELLPRLPAWRHAPPMRRLRVRRRCPRAAMSTGSRRSARATRSLGCVAGGDANKISPSSPSKGALMNVERLDRVAEEVFQGLNEVVADRVHMNSNPGGSCCCPGSTASPPGSRMQTPWRYGERREHRLTPPGVRLSPRRLNPRIPIEGGAPRPGTGRGPPPNEPPSLFGRSAVGEPGGPPPAVAPPGTGVPRPEGRPRRGPLGGGPPPPPTRPGRGDHPLPPGWP